MRMITRFALAAVASAGLLACRSAQRPASSYSDGQCRAEVENADLRGWREVRGAGFTYCVPGNWETSGRIARRGENRVEWNVGLPNRPHDAPPLGTGETRAYAGLTPVIRMTGQPGANTLFREPVDGRPVDFYRERFRVDAARTGYATGAQWLGPMVHFVGVAPEITSSDVQFTIYRTVRFNEVP